MISALPRVALLLPGMDGTGRLFGELRRALSPDLDAHAVSYSSRVAQSYDDLEDVVRGELPRRPFCIIAESFSGPLALRVAAGAPKDLIAVVLVATFVTNPVPWLPAWLAPAAALALRVPPPAYALRRYLLGPDCSPELVCALRDAIRSVRPSVMAARFDQMRRVDATDDLRKCPVPLLVFSACEDRLVPADAVNAMKVLRPDIVHVAVKGPHLLLQRVAPIVAAHIRRFVTLAAPPR